MLALYPDATPPASRSSVPLAAARCLQSKRRPVMSARRILVLSAAPLLFADYLGIPPRPSSADYAAHADSASVSVGASAATSAQVRKVFGWDWTSRYLFFEVALYPEGGKQLTVAPRDFMLRVGADSDSVSPVDAEAIVPGPKPLS